MGHGPPISKLALKLAAAWMVGPRPFRIALPDLGDVHDGGVVPTSVKLGAVAQYMFFGGKRAGFLLKPEKKHHGTLGNMTL